MTFPALLLIFLLPTIATPFVYFAGKKSPKYAAILVAIVALVNIALLLSTVPAVLNNPDHRYIEAYTWITILQTSFTLFVDGISVSVALVSLILIMVAAIFSINYMAGKKNLSAYYALLCMLSIGLVGVFITSNLVLFYFCWELMLIPAYFIIGGWGYRDSYKAAFKFLIFTHAGAVFVLLGIGAIYMTTHTTYMFAAQTALMSSSPDLVKWILVALTAGFSVKMAVVPVHMWLPDAHSEAQATMSALLSGVIISAGAVSPLVESGRVVLPLEGAWLNDFLEEVISVPAAPHDDQVDALTQALAYLRTSTFDSVEWQQVGAMQMAYHAQLRRGAPAFGEMVMNARDMEDIEDGTVNGVRYTNTSIFGNRRGTW